MRLNKLIGCLVGALLVGPALPTPAAAARSAAAAARKKERHRGPAAGRRGRAPAAPAPAAAPPTKLQSLDLDAPPPAAADDHNIVAPALDLSSPPPAADAEKARQEILGPNKAPPAAPAGGGFDFGGGFELGGSAGGDPNAAAGGGLSFDFGNDQPAFDLGNVGAQSEQKKRFEAAMSMMSDEAYAPAALAWSGFLADSAFAEFHDESQYQLGKALYRLGFYGGALKQYEAILGKGQGHRRYRKAVEWLFFMSRKLADQTPVLSQLARYRNVTFPKAYRSEYNYLLSKYLFVQADTFEVQRLQDEELARGKKSKESALDFGAIADAISSPQGDSLDFTNMGGAGALDFGGGGSSALDFGAPSAAPDASGLDFGAPAPAAGGGAGLDFGAAPAAGAAAPAAAGAPTVTAAPTNAKEAIKQGMDLIDQVTQESTFYPRAKYLAGLLHYLAGEDQKAVESFQEVVRVLNPREGARLDPKLREMAFLSLARIHYGYKQFNRSVYYYDLIDRDSESWLTALFEASWAYYRRGDFEKALGNLLTLHSPFFEREYFPESQIVKAIIYFEACRYPETRGIVDDFIKRFTLLMREMQKIAESKDAPEALNSRIEQLSHDAQGEDDDVAARVVSLTLGSSEIRQARAVLAQVEAQRTQLAKMDESFRSSGLGDELGRDLAQQAGERARDAGEVTRKKFEQELYKLKSLLAQALRIKIEVARSERENLEKKMQHQATHDALVQAQTRTVVDDEHVYWPYEGEYWRDELGTYELDFSMCRQTAAD